MIHQAHSLFQKDDSSMSSQVIALSKVIVEVERLGDKQIISYFVCIVKNLNLKKIILKRNNEFPSIPIAFKPESTHEYSSTNF